MSISTPSRSTNGSTHSFAGLPEVSVQQVQDVLSKPGRLLIDGKWLEAASGETFETLNPATEESLGSETRARRSRPTLVSTRSRSQGRRRSVG